MPFVVILLPVMLFPDDLLYRSMPWLLSALPPVLIVLLLIVLLFASVVKYTPWLLSVPFVVMLLFVMLFPDTVLYR